MCVIQKFTNISSEMADIDDYRLEWVRWINKKWKISGIYFGEETSDPRDFSENNDWKRYISWHKHFEEQRWSFLFTKAKKQFNRKKWQINNQRPKLCIFILIFREWQPSKKKKHSEDCQNTTFIAYTTGKRLNKFWWRVLTLQCANICNRISVTCEQDSVNKKEGNTVSFIDKNIVEMSAHLYSDF